MRTTSLLPALALAALAAAAPAAAPAKPPTGTYSGTLTHPEPADDPFTSTIVITVGERSGARRVTGVIATVRTFCGDGVRDIRIVKAGFNGPKLGAGSAFTFTTQGATIRGTIGGRRASGVASAASQGGCELGRATWTADR